MLLRPHRAAVYTLDDMAGDACAVMDALCWASAHIVGMSLGGMIAQVLATTHPDRVRSLTSIASAPGAKIGKPGLPSLMRVVKAADPRRVKTADDMGQYVVDLDRVSGSPAYPRTEDELRAHGRRAFERGGMDLAAVQRQTAAIAARGAFVSLGCSLTRGRLDRPMSGSEPPDAAAALRVGGRADKPLDRTQGELLSGWPLRGSRRRSSSTRRRGRFDSDMGMASAICAGWVRPRKVRR